MPLVVSLFRRALAPIALAATRPVAPIALARTHGFASIALAAMCALASAAAGAAMLTLDEALAQAALRSRSLQAQDSAAGAARHMAVAAGQLPDPTLKLAVTNLPVEGADAWSLTRDFMTMRSIAVMQEFTRDDKRRARAARYEREADAAVAGRSLALATLRRDTALAWFDTHFTERQLELLAALRSETTLQVDAADAAYRGNRAPRADLLAARAALAAVDDRLRQAELQRRVARLSLARWVGDAADAPLGAPPDLRRGSFDPGHLEGALDHHPELALMASREAVARAEAEVARTARRPDWSVELMFSQRGPAYANMVSVGVSVPLPFDRPQRQDRELAAKLAQADQLSAEREEALREHRAQTARWIAQWQGNLERLRFYADEALPLAADRVGAALVAYRGGGGMLAAVLDARRAELDLRLERLRLESETAALWTQLETLMPMDAPGHDAPAPLARRER